MTWNILPIFAFTIGSSIVAPSVTLLLLDLFPRMRGLASSLQGFLQFTLSGFNAGSIAPLLDATLLTMSLGMAGVHCRGELRAMEPLPPHGGTQAGIAL